VDGFSAHADRNGLLDWVRPIADNLKGVYVVHAEGGAADALVEGLHGLGIENAIAPAFGQRIKLD
jgi:predicted metal-dependent RNase